jgi:hypothetical protein
MFLIDDVGSVRGKVLGKISGMDVVGRKRQVVASRRIQHNQYTKSVEETKTKLETELQQYVSVDQWIGWLESIKVRTTMLNQNSEKLQRLQLILEKCNKLQFQLSIKTEIVRVLNVLSPRLNTSKLAELTINEARLTGIYQKKVSLTERLSVAIFAPFTLPPTDSLKNKIQLLASLKNIHAKRSCIEIKPVPQIRIPPLDRTISLTQNLGNLVRIGLKHNELCVGLEQTNNELAIKCSECANAEVELNHLKDVLKVCPTCGKPFDV